MIKLFGDTYRNLLRAASPRVAGLVVGLGLLPSISASYGLRGLAFFAAVQLLIALWFSVTDFGNTTLYAFELKAHFEKNSAFIPALMKNKLFWGLLGGQALFFLNFAFRYVPNSLFSWAAFNVLICSSTIGSTLTALLKSTGSQFGEYLEILLTRVVLLIFVLIRKDDIEEFLLYMSALYLSNCLSQFYRLMKIVKAPPQLWTTQKFLHQSAERAVGRRDTALRYLSGVRLKAVLSAGAMLWVSLILSITTVRVSDSEADVFLAANRVIQICCLPATVFLSAALLSRRDERATLNYLKNKMLGSLGITVLIGSATVFVAGSFIAKYLRINEDLQDVFERSLRVQAIAILPLYFLFLRWANVIDLHSNERDWVTRIYFALILLGPSLGIFFPNHPHWLFTGLILASFFIGEFDGSQSWFGRLRFPARNSQS